MNFQYGGINRNNHSGAMKTKGPDVIPSELWHNYAGTQSSFG